MFIGASPGGTGGGIKTTTFSVMVLHLFSFLKDKEKLRVFGRTINLKTVERAFVIGFMASSWILVSVLALSVTEKSSLMPLLFEVTSAFGTVGLSIGITAHLSGIGKLVITITMILGRVGPITLGVSVLQKKKTARTAYPEGTIWVG